MPMIGRAFSDMVGIGGIIFTGSPNVSANDLPVATMGSLVAPHIGVISPNNFYAIFDPFRRFSTEVHYIDVMITGSLTVSANDIPVCKMGDLASCGDLLISTSNVEVG